MLKNLKSIFIVEEEEEQPKKTSSSAIRPKAPTSNSKSSPRPATPARSGKITPKFTDILLKSMEKANLDGFDYLEFKKSLQSLQKMEMNEATAYQSAFVMAQTMGVTPAHLIKTAQHYLDALSQEEKKFESALANQQQNKIGSKRKELQELQKGITGKGAQILQLQKEIKQDQITAGKLETSVNSAVNNIENTKNDFIASYKNLVNQIGVDMDNMKKHLK